MIKTRSAYWLLDEPRGDNFSNMTKYQSSYAMESSESESLAPTEFPLIDSLESSAGLTVAIERCPLCDESKRRYFCTSCVKNGLFIHSKATICIRFTDFQRKFDRLKVDRDHYLKNCKKALESQIQSDEISMKINECHRKLELFRGALKMINNKNLQDKTRLEALRKSNSNRTLKARTHREKKLLIQKYIKKKLFDIDETNNRNVSILCDLSEIRRLHMDDIQKFIFPVHEVFHSRPNENIMALSTVSALRDASHTTYIGGRWVYSNSIEDGCFAIIEPTLPNNGDYSAYTLWVAANRENAGNTDNSLRNPGHTISGALTFSSQLLSVLSYLLDVRMPWRQKYSEFCGGDLPERHFKDAVSRLGQNIIYLCFSQNLQENHQLDIKNTLQNILYLLQSNHSQNSPIIIDDEMLDSFEEVILQEYYKTDYHSDMTEDVEGDWEQVNEDLTEVTAPCPSYNSMISEIPSMVYTERQSESTLALMSSAAASFFSAFKTNKK